MSFQYLFAHFFFFFFDNAVQLCCPVKLVRQEIQAMGDNEILPLCVFSLCMQIISETNLKLVFSS